MKNPIFFHNVIMFRMCAIKKGKTEAPLHLLFPRHLMNFVDLFAKMEKKYF